MKPNQFLVHVPGPRGDHQRQYINLDHVVRVVQGHGSELTLYLSDGESIEIKEPSMADGIVNLIRKHAIRTDGSSVSDQG